MLAEIELLICTAVKTGPIGPIGPKQGVRFRRCPLQRGFPTNESNEEKHISGAEHGSRNVPFATNLISLLISKLFGLSIKAEKIIFFKKKTKFLSVVSVSIVEHVPYCILLQLLDTLPKLNVSHSTEINSSQRGAIWFEGRYRFQSRKNNCWLVAESKLA